MVKRKAAACWVEGLEKEAIGNDLIAVEVAAEREGDTVTNCPIEEGGPAGLTATYAANGASEVADQEGSAIDVFWWVSRLAGYEEW